MTREEIHNNILEIRKSYKIYQKETEDNLFFADNEGYGGYIRQNELIYETIEAAKEYGMELDLWKYAWEL